jgi:hypothetical protein
MSWELTAKYADDAALKTVAAESASRIEKEW